MGEEQANKLKPSDNEIKQKPSITDILQRYAVRTYKQLFIHFLVAIILAIVINALLGSNHAVSTDNFVVIISSMSAASGVLLAVTLALATFFSRHIKDWADRLVSKLKVDQEKLEIQMEKSARLYPEISNRLTELYMKSFLYIPGQPIDVEEINASDRIFSDWAKEKMQKSNNKFSFGDLNTYNMFEKHLFDAFNHSKELCETIVEIGLVEKAGRSIPTFSPLIISWGLIVLFTLVFAILGSISVIPQDLYIPTLIIPFYLFLISIFALTKDITAILRHMRIKERGYEMAMADLIKRANESNINANG